jgi:hypothetical protein
MSHFKTTQVYYLAVLEIRRTMGLMELKSRCHQIRSLRENVSSSFPASFIPQLIVPLSALKSAVECLPFFLSPSSSPLSFSLWILHSCLLLLGSLWLYWAHHIIQGHFSLSDPWLIHGKVPLPCQVTYLQALFEDINISGDHYSPHHNPQLSHPPKLYDRNWKWSKFWNSELYVFFVWFCFTEIDIHLLHWFV